MGFDLVVRSSLNRSQHDCRLIFAKFPARWKIICMISSTRRSCNCLSTSLPALQVMEDYQHHREAQPSASCFEFYQFPTVLIILVCKCGCKHTHHSLARNLYMTPTTTLVKRRMESSGRGDQVGGAPELSLLISPSLLPQDSALGVWIVDTGD